MQGTAAIIVLGGTLGAVFIGSTVEDIKTGVSLLKGAFFTVGSVDSNKMIEEIVDAAQTARKESILALERKISGFSSPFMQTVFRFVVDGVDPKTIHDIFENEIFLERRTQKRGREDLHERAALLRQLES